MSRYLRFEKLLDKQCEDVIRFLSKEKVNFALVCEVKNVVFDPPLPQEILEGFQPLSLFVLAGYTFDSLAFSQDGIMFEAGFGPNNIGSFVQINFRHILQLSVSNHKSKDMIVFRRLDGFEIFGDEEQNKIQNLQQSMQAILSNPHNQKYFQ